MKKWNFESEEEMVNKSVKRNFERRKEEENKIKKERIKFIIKNNMIFFGIIILIGVIGYIINLIR